MAWTRSRDPVAMPLARTGTLAARARRAVARREAEARDDVYLSGTGRGRMA